MPANFTHTPFAPLREADNAESKRGNAREERA